MPDIFLWQGGICPAAEWNMRGYSSVLGVYSLCFSRLSLCEKALAEYLDRKRLAFPRFYFISSADLLDILSNGTNPQLVSIALCHLCISSCQ